MHGFRIGKLFGFEIRVDWSWLFIALLLTWNLSNVFSRWHPDWPSGEPVAVAFVASVLFFGCILLHELAHALVAKRYGLRVRSITLFLFGGVSNIEHEPPSPRAEFFIAVVGPVTSILLGLGFLAASVLSLAVSLRDTGAAAVSYAGLGPLETLVAWLGPINLIIGVFNLVPAFPLDGGRVLRSILWGMSGDLRVATRRASAVGQVFGWFFIVTGIAMVFGVNVVFFGTGVVGGLWLAFIGWFLHTAASQSCKRLAIDDALAGHTVQEIMRRSSLSVAPELTVDALVHEYFVRSEVHGVAVVKDDRLVGLVSISDVGRIPAAEWSATPVSRVMRPSESLAVATPDEPVALALEELARRNVEQLPVLDHGQLVGMLQRRDVTRWLGLAWGGPVSAT